MAELNPNNTTRWKVRYQQGSHEHVFQVRTAPAVSPAEFGTWLATFLTSIGPALYTLTVTEITRAVAGSDIFLPFTTGIEGQQWGGGNVNTEGVPRYLDFVGRSSGGRRVRLAVFGYQGPVSDFRVTVGEDVHVQDAVNMLNEEGTIGLAVDGVKAQWKPYANMGYNAHWQRAVRS